MRHGGVSVGDFRGPSRTAIFNEGPSRMKRLLLGASAVIALSAGHAVRADDDYHFHDTGVRLSAEGGVDRLFVAKG